MPTIRIMAISALLATAVAGNGAVADDVAGNARAERTKFLLLDSRIIEGTSNAKLAASMATKHPNNPLFGEDKPPFPSST